MLISTTQTNRELLILADKGRADSVSITLNGDPFRLSVPEALSTWAHSTKDSFRVISINFE